MRATLARIYLGNLRHNFRLLRKISGKARILASVKADAYGHGAVPIARVLAEEGCDWLGVATVDEARELREGGVLLPILLLGLALSEEAPHLCRYGVSAVASDRDYIAILGRSAENAQQVLGVHLEVDVGMGRLGCSPTEAKGLLAYGEKFPYLRWEGLMTHFPSSDNAQAEPTRSQFLNFCELVERLREHGYAPPLVHTANSGAILAHPETHADMVRPGILLYGYLPNRNVSDPHGFRPVMEFESRVMLLKDVGRSTTLSYGSTYVTQRPTRVATVGAGYGDGYPRSLSNKAPVRIGKDLYTVSGLVCMDQFMVDTGPQSGVRRWEKVVLFGPWAEGPTAWDLAEIAGTIPYEITCAVSRRVRRIYTEESALF